MSDTPDFRRFSMLTARDVMRENVITVSYSTPLSEVERVLSENRISGVPVTDAAGHVMGVISASDLLQRYTDDPDSRPRRSHGYFHLSSEELEDEDYEAFDIPEEAEETAETVMNNVIYTVDEEATLQQVSSVMTEHRIHRVLVTDSAGAHVIGLISTLDILSALAG